MSVRHRFWSSAVALAVVLGGTSAARADVVKLRVGTAAAPDSPWGTSFKTWKKAVETKTGETVSFDFYFNSTQGSEVTMVDKLKAGQLDGAALTSLGLARFDKRLQVMQLPGVIRSWKTLDAVRDGMGAELEKMLTDKKVTLVNWGDIGLVHFLSKGFSVKVPDDLKGKSPWIYADDPTTKTLYGKVGGVTPFAAELMTVLPNIDNGKINCISAPALAAEMLQWNAKFDHGVDSVNAIAVGGLVLSTEALDKLPGDGKKAVLDTGKAMSSSAAGLKQKLRNEDAAAWDRFKTRSGVEIYKPSDDDIAKWKPIFVSTIETLKTGTFEATLVDKVVSLAAKAP